MALENSDLLVVQKSSGNKELRKATLTQVANYLQTTDVIEYKGARDFTQSGAAPQAKNLGDLYINNAIVTGNFAWGDVGGSIFEVSPGDRCLWNGATWDVIVDTSGGGVVDVTGTLPIEIEKTNKAEPNITVKDATTTTTGVVVLADAGDVSVGTAGKVVTADQLKTVADSAANVKAEAPLKADPTGPGEITLKSDAATTTAPGHVSRLATSADVDGTTGTGGDAVVTADLLKATNSELVNATKGGLTEIIGQEPIVIDTTGSIVAGSSSTKPAVTVKNASFTETGVIKAFDYSIDLGDPADSTNYGEWIETLDKEAAVSMYAVGKNFVPGNFEGLEEA